MTQSSIVPKDEVLNNTDILRLVFGLFEQSPAQFLSRATGVHDELSANGRKDLRNFALVCKAFNSPALDYLWKHLDNLTPLLKLHPALQVVDGSYFFLPDYTDKGTKNEVERFRAYSTRVRSVALWPGDKDRTHPISLTGMAWLGKQCHDTPLLPGLESIMFEDPKCDSVHMALLPLIMSHTIKNIAFNGVFLSADAFKSYALPFACHSSVLRGLSLSDPTSSSHAEIWSTITKLFDPLNRLEDLSLQFPKNPTMAPDFLSQLAQNLDLLTHLTLDIHCASHAPSTDVIGQELLPSLQTLKLVNRNGCSLCPCYPAFLLKRATCIIFELSESVINPRAFLEAVEATCPMSSLAQVIIKAPHNTVHLAAIRGFLTTLNLGVFTVDAKFLQTDLNDGQDVNDLINAAFGDRGALQSLSLPIRCVTANGYTGKSAPLSSMVHIAKAGHLLEHIAFSINSHYISTDTTETINSLMAKWQSSADVETLKPSKLRHLQIADMRPSNVPFTPSAYRDIAQLLDTIFPNLQRISMINHPEREKTWDEHWKLIEEHRRMRKALRICGMNLW